MDCQYPRDPPQPESKKKSSEQSSDCHQTRPNAQRMEVSKAMALLTSTGGRAQLAMLRHRHFHLRRLHHLCQIATKRRVLSATPVRTVAWWSLLSPEVACHPLSDPNSLKCFSDHDDHVFVLTSVFQSHPPSTEGSHDSSFQ